MDASLPKVYETLLSVARHIIMELLLQNQMVACMVYSMHSLYNCDTFMQMQGVVYVSFNDWIISMVVACIVGGGGGGEMKIRGLKIRSSHSDTPPSSIAPLFQSKSLLNEANTKLALKYSVLTQFAPCNSLDFEHLFQILSIASFTYCYSASIMCDKCGAFKDIPDQHTEGIT